MSCIIYADLIKETDQLCKQPSKIFNSKNEHVNMFLNINYMGF